MAQPLKIKADTFDCKAESALYSSGEAGSHYWNMGEYWAEDSVFQNKPVPDIQNLSFRLSGPYSSNYLAVAEDSGDVFIFIPNNANGLVRYRYHRSIRSKPEYVSLGYLNNVLLGITNSISLLREGDKWYGIVLVGSSYCRVIRLDFGTSLKNIPVATEVAKYYNSPLSGQPYFFRHQGRITGFVVSRGINGFVRIDFGNSVENVPEFKQVIFPYRHAQFLAFTMGQDVAGNFWFFGPSISSGNFILVRFGNNPMNNNPQIDSLGSFGIGKRDYAGAMSYVYGNKVFIWVNDANNRQVFLRFGNGIYRSPDKIVNLANPYKVIWTYGYLSPAFRFRDTLYAISCHGREGLSILKFRSELPGMGSVFHHGFSNRQTAVMKFDGSVVHYRKSKEVSIRYILNEGQVNQRDTLFAMPQRNCENTPVCSIYIPGSFTPNGDGLNDKLDFKCPCDLNYAELLVYDRWGSLIYRSGGGRLFWDGRFREADCEEGIYFYRLLYRVEDHTGRLSVSNGMVTLLR